jgi:hypothetical protein
MPIAAVACDGVNGSKSLPAGRPATSRTTTDHADQARAEDSGAAHRREDARRVGLNACSNAMRALPRCAAHAMTASRSRGFYRSAGKLKTATLLLLSLTSARLKRTSGSVGDGERAVTVPDDLDADAHQYEG